jgi:hypothetical protein
MPSRFDMMPPRSSTSCSYLLYITELQPLLLEHPGKLSEHSGHSVNFWLGLSVWKAGKDNFICPVPQPFSLENGKLS